MSEPMFVITEEELRGMEICQQRICHTIRSRPLPEALKQQRTKMLDAFKTIPRFRQHSINADCIYAADLDQTIEVWENYD